MSFAQMSNGKPVFPETFSETEWLALKKSYQINDFLMPCCGTPAIPKTSINGARFFSHYADECTSAPESQWHVATKDHLARTLLKLGAQPIIEQSIGNENVHMKPDVHFVWGGRLIALEVQRSYQTLDEYLRRQKRYNDAGIEGYWLLHLPRYITLSKASGRLRLKRDFAGKLPIVGSFYPALPELPVVIFKPDEDGGRITGAGCLNLSLHEWLVAITTQQFRWNEGAWVVGADLKLTSRTDPNLTRRYTMQRTTSAVDKSTRLGWF